MRNALVFAAALLLVAPACKSEIDGKSAAKVSDVPPTAAPQTSVPDAKPVEVPFDLTESSIEWTAAKVTADEHGGFAKFNGTVTYGPGGEITAIETQIETASVFAKADRLTKHLKSPDFLGVEEFPTASFRTTEIKPAPDGSYTVTGVLDLHGVQKEISFGAKIATEGPNSVASAEFTLQRFDFGIAFPGKPDDLIKPEVLMKLRVVAPRPPG